MIKRYNGWKLNVLIIALKWLCKVLIWSSNKAFLVGLDILWAFTQFLFSQARVTSSNTALYFPLWNRFCWDPSSTVAGLLLLCMYISAHDCSLHRFPKSVNETLFVCAALKCSSRHFLPLSIYSQTTPSIKVNFLSKVELQTGTPFECAEFNIFSHCSKMLLQTFQVENKLFKCSTSFWTPSLK